MGINGLWPLTKKYSQASRCQTITLEGLRGKRVALDANGFLYQFLFGSEKDFNYLDQFVWLYLDLKEVDSTAIFVFDGKPPPEKEEAVRIGRQERKKKLLDAILDLEFKIEQKEQGGVPIIVEDPKQEEEEGPKSVEEPVTGSILLSAEDLLELKQLKADLTRKKNQYLDASPEKVRIVKTVLEMLGAIVITSPEGEAEGTCAILNRLGHVDVVVSKDSDCIVFGAINQLREIPMKQKRDLIKLVDSPHKASPMILCDLKGIREDMSLTDPDILIDFAILSGCDYTNREVYGLGIVKAYDYILKHGTIEKVLVEWKKVVEKRIAQFPKTCLAKLKKEMPGADAEELEYELENRKYNHALQLKIPEMKDFNYVAARKIFKSYLDVTSVSPEILEQITNPLVPHDQVTLPDNVEKLKAFLRETYCENENVLESLDQNIGAWLHVFDVRKRKLESSSSGPSKKKIKIIEEYFFFLHFLFISPRS